MKYTLAILLLITPFFLTAQLKASVVGTLIDGFGGNLLIYDDAAVNESKKLI